MAELDYFGIRPECGCVTAWMSGTHSSKSEVRQFYRDMADTGREVCRAVLTDEMRAALNRCPHVETDATRREAEPVPAPERAEPRASQIRRFCMTQFRAYSIGELGTDGYPPIWHERLKHEVREAAGNRCVRCHHPYTKGAGEWSRCDKRCQHRGPVRLSYMAEDGSAVEHLEHTLATEAGVVVGYGKRVEAHWRILTVHHLDGDKANCRWWNLVALCQRCHLTIQGRVQMARVYPWEHSEWFKPYVAGYYAWTYLSEDLDREATELRLDELLGLELSQSDWGKTADTVGYEP